MRQLLIFLALITATMLLVPGAAHADDCADVCTASTPCDTECGWDPGKGGPVTCEEYGVCDEGGGGSCTPNFQKISTTVVGGFQHNNYFANSCDYIQVLEHTWSDVNSCTGSTNYTTCGTRIHASQSGFFCCSSYWCGGQTSC